METFPVPNLLPNLFAEMPEPGTLITESEALRILRTLLRTIYALTGTLHEQLRSHGEDETYLTVSDLILQYFEPAQALLEAWYEVWSEHHGSPAARLTTQPWTTRKHTGAREGPPGHLTLWKSDTFSPSSPGKEHYP